MAEDLRSWHDTATRAAIVDFVERVTEEGGRDYAPPTERIAVFDNDGTLWCEKPMPIELGFILMRLAEMVEADGYPDREFGYTAGAEQSLERAAEKDWTVVSVKNDWATVFADAGP